MILMVFWWMVEGKIQIVKVMTSILQMPFQVPLKMLMMTQKLGFEKPFLLTSLNEDYLKHQQNAIILQTLSVKYNN